MDARKEYVLLWLRMADLYARMRRMRRNYCESGA